MVTHNHPTTLQTEEGELSSEQEEQEYQDLDRQDEQLFHTWLTLGLAVSLFPIQKQALIYNAFSALAQPPEKTIDALLDFKNPVKYRAHHEAIKTTRKQFKKQEKKLKRTLEPKEKVGVRFFHLKVKLSPEELLRQRQVHIVARKVHTIVNNREIDIRIQNTIRRYGISQEKAGLFKNSLQKWLRENPGRNLDQALVVKAREFFLAQRAGVEPEALDEKTRKRLEREHRKELKRNKKALLKDNKSAREQVIESIQKDGTLARAKEVLEKDVLDINKAPLTAEELKKANRYIEQGLIPQAGPITERKLAGGFAEVPEQYADELMDYPPPAPLPQPTVQQPSVQQPSPLPPLSPSPSSLIPTSRLSRIFAPLQQRIPSGLRTGFSSITSPVKSLFSKFKTGPGNLLGGLGNKLGGLFSKGKSILSKVTSLAVSFGKKLIARGLDAVAPGLGFATQKINDVIKSLTGIDVMGTGVQLAIFAIILLAVGIPIILLFLVGNMFSHVTSKNPMKVKISSLKDAVYTWQEFEKQFLISNKERLFTSWRQFEKENLLPVKKHLSQNQE